MTDLDATAGRFIEITAINDTLLTTGPTGQVSRVSITASYQRGICKGSISFHWDAGQWKLLGIGLELPPELKILSAARATVSRACKDHDRSPHVRRAQRRRDHPPEGDPRRQGARGLGQRDRRVQEAGDARAVRGDPGRASRRVLGAYKKRILRVTEAKVIGGTSATFDVVTEVEHSNGVRTVFGFERDSKSSPWQLRNLKASSYRCRGPTRTIGTSPPVSVPPDAGVPRDAGGKR